MTLEARLWLALAILAGVMCALLFGTAGTTQYWQAWVYVSIFLGASVLTTFCVDPMSVAIRRADVRDIQKIETVARAAWPVVYAGIIPDEVQSRLLDSWYSLESLRRALAMRGSSFFVAESSGHVVGFAQFVRRSGDSVELTRIYVLPAKQRCGIGTQLLHAGLREFAAEGLERLTVSVERDNPIGRRFYERSGFGEPRHHSQEVQGHVMALVEYCRPIP